MVNATPLTFRQLRALLAVAFRETTWVLPNVAREVACWRERAALIPDPSLRADALATLDRERLNTEGAALFATVPVRRNHGLLRLLSAYQIALDYLDTISERPSPDPLANGRQLHLALTEALDPGGPISDYYRHHDVHDDGGYLRELVEVCRQGCAALPAFSRVRSRIGRAAERATVQIVNHDPDAARRDRALEAWAEHEFPERDDTSWFELTAAASSTLWIHALLSLAVDPLLDGGEIEVAERAYMPWINAASTLLDAFVDQADDAATGNHNYMTHYATPSVAQGRLAEIVNLSMHGAAGLIRGERHALIAAGMVSMYLSKDSARTPELAPATREILRAAGSLPRVQLPIMRAMRLIHRLADA